MDIAVYIFVIAYMSSFVRVATTLSILRMGLGLKDWIFGVVVLVLSLAIGFLSILPYLGNELLVESHNINKVSERLLPFWQKHTDPDMERLIDDYLEESRLKSDQYKDTQTPSAESGGEIPSDTLFSFLPKELIVFVLSELKGALYAGLMMLIPFVLVDLFVVNILALLSITQISAQSISVPLKLGIFLAVDGWDLFVGRVLGM